MRGWVDGGGRRLRSSRASRARGTPARGRTSRLAASSRLVSASCSLAADRVFSASCLAPTATAALALALDSAAAAPAAAAAAARSADDNASLARASSPPSLADSAAEPSRERRSSRTSSAFVEAGIDRRQGEQGTGDGRGVDGGKALAR